MDEGAGTQSDEGAPAASGAVRSGGKGPIIAVAVLVVVGLVGAGLWFFLRDDAPPPVSIETAVGGGSERGEGPPAPTGTLSPGDTSGTWTVDTSVGEFDFENATGSFVGFRVEEELTVGSTTAVGRTPDVSGQITIDGTTLTAASFEADMTSITTNDGRRDNKVQEALDTSSFPTATFELTSPVELGAGALDGEEISVDATGDLTLHGISREVTISLQAKLEGDRVVVVGSMPIVFADYDVEPPTAPIVLSVAPEGILELQLFFTKS